MLDDIFGKNMSLIASQFLRFSFVRNCCNTCMASPYVKAQKPRQEVYSLLPSRTSFPDPEVSEDKSRVCAMRACYELESSECGNSRPIFIRTWA
jgi:hypothetical protein